MHLLIDRDRMCVLYKHPNVTVLDCLAHIELQESATVIAEIHEDDEFFGTLTDWELRLLHEHLCGQKYHGYGRDHLIRTVRALCEVLEIANVGITEALTQAQAIPDDDKGFYRFVPGSMTPAPQEELFYPAALKTAPGFAPSVPLNRPEKTAPSVLSFPATLYKNVPRAAVTITDYKPSAPPATGSKTGRVWEIADGIFGAQDVANADWKALRKQIVEACEAEGINSSTASVQYSKWKQTKL